MASYFLGSRLLGTSRQLPMFADDQMSRTSEALFCPACGEIWGRIHEPMFKEWSVQVRYCAKHFAHPNNWCGDASGSFIASWRRTFAELPPEVLAYEAILRLERYSNDK